MSWTIFDTFEMYDFYAGALWHAGRLNSEGAPVVPMLLCIDFIVLCNWMFNLKFENP